MATTVTDSPENNRFTLQVDGATVGFAQYRRDNDSITFTHTEVNPDRQEHGLGSTLVEQALTEVRETTSLRVVPSCPFVAAFIDEHPEYQDLLQR